MALENFAGKGSLSFPAGADLSTKQYFIVKLNASGQVVLAVAGQGDFILLNKPTSGQVAEVAPLDGRLCKVSASGVLTAGNDFTSDANGQAKAVTLGAGTGSRVLGKVVTAPGAANEVFTAYVMAIGAAPTTDA
jgi:hypothetical protein